MGKIARHARGEGAIRRRKDGKFETRVALGYDNEYTPMRRAQPTKRRIRSRLAAGADGKDRVAQLRSR